MRSKRFYNLLTQQASTGKKIHIQELVEISCYIQNQQLLTILSIEWDLSVTNVGVCVQQIQIEESVDSKLRVVP